MDRQRAIKAIESVTFPATAEQFVAAQEAGMGRKLTAKEREICAFVADLANMGYRDGLDGRECIDFLNGAEEYIPADRLRDDKFVFFLHHIDFWVRRANKAGKEARRAV